MTRAIVRFSLDGDGGGTNNDVRKCLRNAGFVRTGTSTFECEHDDQAVALEALSEMLAILGNPRGGGTVDHVWIYLDEVRYPGL